MIKHLIISSWNVRGLGRHKKCTDVKAGIVATQCSIICCQETKLNAIDRFKAMTFLPPNLRDFDFIPSTGASGGILTAWDSNLWTCSIVIKNQLFLSCKFESKTDDLFFTLTNVYGPYDPTSKRAFLDLLLNLSLTISGPWAIIGDFNLILRPSGKSSTNFNSIEAMLFSDVIQSMRLQDLPLLDRRYTWSNQQDAPILVRLDRALVNVAWAQHFPDSALTSSTRSTSDHVPIQLSAATQIPKPLIFRLNNVLLANPSFLEKVASNWASVGSRHLGRGSVGMLALRLKRTREMAKKWSANYRLPTTMAKNCHTTINFLDKIEESRMLSSIGLHLRTAVKLALHRFNADLAVYWRQRAKIQDCVLGDENSAYLHICASVRYRKNQIKSLMLPGPPTPPTLTKSASC